MEIIAYEMEYTKEEIHKCNIECILFDKQYLQEYMTIYNECFYEMRKALDVQPYNFLSEFEQIKDRMENIFLLVEDGEIVGSVACYGNEIDDLIVNTKFQHRGYGKQLLLWGMNRIRQNNNDSITLHVAQWNENAVNLYKNTGFNIIRTERVR